MPTIRQEKLATKLIENAASRKPMGAVELVADVGYSEKTAYSKPGQIIDSPGVREALIKKGFSVERADEVVTEILNGGKGEHNRLKAADMIYERLGAKVPPPAQNNIQNNFFLSSPEAILAAQQFEETLKRNLYVAKAEETSLPLETDGSEAGGSQTP